MVNEQVTTIELTAGTPSTVEFSGAYPYYWVDNRSAGDVYASLGTPEAGTDGTYTIAAGSQLRISGGAFNTKLSLLGSGKVQVIASGIASCPFKGAQGGGENITVDSELSETSTNPVQNKVINAALEEKALRSLYSDTTINIGRKEGSTVGEYSTAEGFRTTASGNYSHAEGSNVNSKSVEYNDITITISDVDYIISGSTAYGIDSHAEGTQTFSYGYSSHAEGFRTITSNTCSHAEGNQTIASGHSSHAEGFRTTASGNYSHAEGYGTTASNDVSHASGKYSAAMTDGGAINNTTGTAFVIGNGTSNSELSNAFSVQFDGTVKAASTITASTTADYAEFFEWLDGNPGESDRVGYFVTLDGDKIRIATNEDNYILGVVSGEPFVLGNGDCDVWNGMFLRDEFRRTIYEPAPKIIEVDGEFVEVEGEFEGTRPKLNPEYDNTQKYISRFERKEWAPVGMLGVLAVRHDGTAAINGYVTVNSDGIATACDKNSENSYRVIKSNAENVVEIIFR